MTVIAVVMTILVFFVVAFVLLAGARKPKVFRVERSIDIRCAPKTVFTQIDDFHAWGAWSPWEKLDPAMVKTYSGAEKGFGSRASWKGNRKAGEGNMEIIKSVPVSRILVRLEFIQPFAAVNTAEFLLSTKDGTRTQVTWAIFGPMAFPMRVMSVFVDIDAFMGKDFDRGLSSLKAICEKG